VSLPWSSLFTLKGIGGNLSAPQRSVLVTGSHGAVARMILPHLEAQGLRLRLADRTGFGDEQADLSAPQACERICSGMSAVLHLAAAPPRASSADLLANNCIALANILESAVKAGSTHFVFFSSMHVMGMYRRNSRITEQDEIRPDNPYAVSKVYGEALCRLYNEKHGLTVASVRLGGVAPAATGTDPGAWISPEDVAAMVRVSLQLPRNTYETFHAVADYSGGPLPESAAHRYGYRCSRPAGSYSDDLKRAQRWWHDDPWALSCRGGSFAAEGAGPFEHP